MPTAHDGDAESIERETFGPHALVPMHYFVNDVGRDAMAQTRSAFPEGSVIIKQKLLPDGETLGIGGMIKRESGFDPTHGDWSYFYLSHGNHLRQGRLKTCRTCHAKTQHTDHVFIRGRDWKTALDGRLIHRSDSIDTGPPTPIVTERPDACGAPTQRRQPRRPHD
ncbi:cytochrome P460 family protein [Ahniella affigens]|uniref:cytochrome P460 family protein n=1 Tax=Ahniella affigens TaxID=2021234 RepID=UPI0011B25FFC|nr:cytochrome P460 family protein [Ahniella affigens]